VAEEDEQGEAMPEGCSPKHKWWWRGGAKAVEDSRRAGTRARGELESKGRRCGGSQGSSRVHIEGRGTAVEG
jgi:hypothetical protein